LGGRVFELAAQVVVHRRAEAIELLEVLHAFGGLTHSDQRVAELIACLWAPRIQRDRAAQGAFRGVEPIRGKMNPADGAERRCVLAAKGQRQEEFRQGLVSTPDTREGEPEILVRLRLVQQQPRALCQRGDDLFVLLMAARELGYLPVDRGPSRRRWEARPPPRALRERQCRGSADRRQPPATSVQRRRPALPRSFDARHAPRLAGCPSP
jgi:hypothetical protein